MISIIIPSYNHSKYIKKCIDSVFAQTYQDWELIIIDDGSKDNSNQIIAQYNDKRITHIRQENAGAHNAINKGISIATGNYIAFLNSDDEYHKDRLQKCITIFEQKPSIDFISTWLNIVDDDSKILGLKQAWENLEPWPVPDKMNSYYYSSSFSKKLLCGNFIATTSNMIFKKDILNKIGMMENLRFTHDWDFALRASLFGNCEIIPEYLLKYRLHANNTIKTNQDWLNIENAWVWATYYPEVFESSQQLGLTEFNPNKFIEEFESSSNFLHLEKLIILIQILQKTLNTKYVLNNKDILESLILYAKRLPANEVLKVKSIEDSKFIKKIIKNLLAKTTYQIRGENK